MDMQRFTHLGRSVDLAYPTNRAIIVMSLSVLLGVAAWGLLVQDWLLRVALAQGVGYAGAVFLTWALGREFDPDGEILAFFPIPLMLLLLFWLGHPDFRLLFLNLLLMRIVNRTTGLAAKPGDVLFVLVLMTWSAHDGYWYIVLCTAIAFGLDAFLVQPQRSHRWVAMLLLIIAIFLFFKSDLLYNFNLLGWGLWLVLGGIAGVSVMLFSISEIGSASDYGGILHLQRVQAAWLLVLLSVLLTSCFQPQGLAMVAPIWAIFIVIGGCRLLWRMFS